MLSVCKTDELVFFKRREKQTKTDIFLMNELYYNEMNSSRFAKKESKDRKEDQQRG